MTDAELEKLLADHPETANLDDVSKKEEAENLTENNAYKESYDKLTAALKSNPSQNLFTEPPSPADPDNPPLYPYNDVWDSESGHSIQLDDTPGRERVSLQHGKSGNFIEMHPNGDQVIKVFGESFDITIGKKNIYVTGVCNIVVNGDCNMQVNGDFNHEVNGDYNLAVKGKYNLRAVENMSLSGDSDVSISANEQFGGQLNLTASDSLNLGSDLFVHGSIACDTLTADSRVNAGMGVYAGPYGFTSSLGGLSLGLPTPLTPVATPGCINIVGSMTALGSVNAPIGNFAKTNIGYASIGISSAVLMTDYINTWVYDYHWHPTAHGPSGLPDLPMV